MSDIKVKKTRKSRAKKTAVALPSLVDQSVQLPVIRITNPFDLRQHVRETVTWLPNQPLSAYFPFPSTELVISINGKIVPKEHFSVTYLDKFDNLVICPVPTGGDDDGGKGVMSIIAMIAITIMTAGAGAALAASMGLTGTALTVGGALIQAGISIAGAMLVNAIFAPPKKTEAKQSPTYGIDGAKNTSVEGIPVPVCYGEFRMAGNILGVHVENDGDTQILYMLLNAGEGPIAGIADIEINDNPISDYKDVETQVRLGLENQLPIPWFNETIVAQNKQLKITTDWMTHTTTTEVDKFRIDVVCPGGLYESNVKKGSTKPRSVDLIMQYRPHGATGELSWQSMPTTSEIVFWRNVTGTFVSTNGSIYDSDSGRVYRYEDTQNGEGRLVEIVPDFAWVFDDDGVAVMDQTQLDYLRNNPVSLSGFKNNASNIVHTRVPVYGDVTRITSDKRSAVRKSFSTPKLTASKYDIRIRRATPKSDNVNVSDDVYVSDINEIQTEPLSYPHTALLGVKIRLTDQLNGIPSITFINKGRQIQAYGRAGTFATKDEWYVVASKNPAWVVWDILTNRRYGGAMPTSRLDFIAFKNWAAYCDEEGLTWNGPIDSEMNVWDACQLVLRCGHAQLVNVGTRYTVVIEKAADPVMMFSVANMIEGTYKETWLSTTDRANEIDVTFFDKTDKYKQRTIRVYDPASLAAGAKQRSSAITLYGVDDYERAYKEGLLQLNLNRYILKTINFSAPMEAVACTVGDLIYVQHDMTEWAQAGRFETGSTTTTLNLDRPVKMEAGKQYKLLAVHDAVQRYSGSVFNVAGTSLFLTNFDNLRNVKRIQIGGRDLRVSATFGAGPGTWGVVVDDTVGITVGATYTLWDTDVIEEYNVLNQLGETSVLTLQSPMSFAPAQFVQWMFGETDKVKKPFRVRSISGSHDYRRDITALEYNAAVYDFSNYDAGQTPVIPPQQGVIGPVTNMEVYEETYVDGTNIRSKVVVSWQAPQVGMYSGVDVYVKRNDGQLIKEAEVRNVTSYDIPAAKADKLVVKVVAFDVFGKRSSFEIAPTQTYTVIGEISQIDVGAVTGADVYWSGRDCKIYWRYNSVTHSYEFGSELNGADAGALDPHFKDYEIRVYNADKTILRRTEYASTNSYTYSYDRNFADGIARRLVFEIRMRDIFNNLGNPTTLEAYNPPPTVTGVNTTASFESATVSYTHSADPDFAGARIWLSRYASDLQDLGSPTAADKLVYEGPDASVLLPGLMFNADYYFRIAAYDAFGFTELQPTTTMHFKTSYLNVEAIADGVLGDSKLIPELKSRIDLIDAPATVVGSVAQRLLDEVNARGTAITELQDTMNGADAALASSISTVSAKTDSNLAAIQDETTARTTQDAALASQISTLATQVGNNTAAITNEATTRASAISAEAQQRNEQLVSYDTTIRSYIQSYSYSRATADSTTSSIFSTLRSEYQSGDSGTLSSAQSYVQSYAYSKAATDSAISTQVNQVSARLNSIGGSGVTVEQKFTAQADTNAGLLGQYTVKVDANGYVSGFGLASTSKNGTPTSEFVVNADKFAVISPSYPSAHPFTVGTVNGSTRVIMDSALIGDAAITSAKIGNLQVNSAKIADLTVGTNKITGSAVTQAATANSGIGASVGINLQGGQPVLIFATQNYVNPAGGSGDEKVALTITRNGSQLNSIEDSAAPSYSDSADAGYASGKGALTMYAVDMNPPAGWNTYSAVFSGSTNGVEQPSANITVLELKR